MAHAKEADQQSRDLLYRAGAARLFFPDVGSAWGLISHGIIANF